MAESVRALKVSLPSDREILLEREFDAPRALVFEAFTKPEHIKQWWGRKGSTLPVCEIDLRPGGEWRFVERGADGDEHPFKGVYREISPPEKLVYTFIYDVAPFDQYEAVENITLEENDGRTVMKNLTLYASPEVRDGVLQSGMEEGANESMERLEELLRSLDN